eukprot:2896301-Amphidinium_carterae.2
MWTGSRAYLSLSELATTSGDDSPPEQGGPTADSFQEGTGWGGCRRLGHGPQFPFPQRLSFLPGMALVTSAS